MPRSPEWPRYHTEDELFYGRHGGRPSPAMRNFIVSEPSTPGMDVKFTLAPNITRAAVAVARNNAARADAEAFATAALSSIPAHVQGALFTSMNRAGISNARRTEILANAGRNSSFEIETTNLTSSSDDEEQPPPPVSRRKRKLAESKSESGREVKIQPKKPKYDFPVYETSVSFPNEARPKTIGKDSYEEVDIKFLCTLPFGTEFLTTNECTVRRTGETGRRGFIGNFVSETVKNGEIAVRYTSRKPGWLRVPANGIPWSPRIYHALYEDRFYLKRPASLYEISRQLESLPIGVEDGIVRIIIQFL